MCLLVGGWVICAGIPQTSEFVLDYPAEPLHTSGEVWIFKKRSL